MAITWRKAKVALGLKFCISVPRSQDDELPALGSSTARFSDAGVSSLPAILSAPSTPTPSSSGLRLLKSESKSSRRICAICLGTMKPGDGHALFTAECSHTFHFHCIASNVKHGNQVCPVCRAKWKEIPFQKPPSDLNHGRARINPVDWPQDDRWMTVVRRLPPHRTQSNRAIFHSSEPSAFNDDELLDPQLGLHEKSLSVIDAKNKKIEIKTYPEFSAIPRSTLRKNFNLLVHLQAPFIGSRQKSGCGQPDLPVTNETSRAPIDLVAVLDVSGSMAGTKLALLKRAMGFVIQNLGSSDRLSVIAFSSTARRLFRLGRMSDSGRQRALQAVNSLTSSGGTNILEGLKKGSKVMEDRREKNPVSSIILLSDGQDTYTVAGVGGFNIRPDYQSLLPFSLRGGTSFRIPVHTFGFGMDHDAALMHSISQASGGTFSFIEAESVIQDAFAQCIGGLLSVVVQDLHVGIQCLHPGVRISSIKAGSYASSVLGEGKNGSINVGDLYADEERDFLLSIDVPSSGDCQEMALVSVACIYRDPISKERVNLAEHEVKIERPENVSDHTASLEVDRQRNRLEAAEAMAKARSLAELDDLGGAVAVLENSRKLLSESAVAQGGDQLCIALEAELMEMQQRMASRQAYEASGRAYVLSGMSSHSWQRATTRGDSTESMSFVHTYQTPSMVNMLTRSQTMGSLRGSPNQPAVRPALSFLSQPQPR